MIVRAHTATEFGRLLRYVAEPAGASRLLANLQGGTPAALEHEMLLARRTRPACRRPALHLAARLAPGDRLSRSRWNLVARRLVAGLGLAESPFVSFLHPDPHGEHLHIVASRVSWNGEAVASRYLKRRCLLLGDRIGRDLWWSRATGPVAPAPDPARRWAPGFVHRPTVLDRRRIANGDEPQKAALAAAVLEAASGCGNWRELLDRLAQRGVAVRPRICATGEVRGIAFRRRGVAFAGSSLGPGLSWFGLQHHLGLRYRPASDLGVLLAALRTSRGTATSPGPPPPRQPAAPPIPHLRPTRPETPETPAIVVEEVAHQARAHLEALGAEGFEVVLLDATTGARRRLPLAAGTAEEVLAAVPELIRWNLAGCEVLLRASGRAPLFCVPDVSASALADARGEGFLPAAVVSVGGRAADRPEAWFRLPAGEPAGRWGVAGGKQGLEDFLVRRLCGLWSADRPACGHLAGFLSPMARELAALPAAPAVVLVEGTGRVCVRAAAPAAGERDRRDEELVAARVEREIAAQGSALDLEAGLARELARDPLSPALCLPPEAVGPAAEQAARVVAGSRAQDRERLRAAAVLLELTGEPTPPSAASPSEIGDYAALRARAAAAEARWRGLDSDRAAPAAERREAQLAWRGLRDELAARALSWGREPELSLHDPGRRQDAGSGLDADLLLRPVLQRGEQSAGREVGGARGGEVGSEEALARQEVAVAFRLRACCRALEAAEAAPWGPGPAAASHLAATRQLDHTARLLACRLTALQRERSGGSSLAHLAAPPEETVRPPDPRAPTPAGEEVRPILPAGPAGPEPSQVREAELLVAERTGELLAALAPLAPMAPMVAARASGPAAAGRHREEAPDPAARRWLAAFGRQGLAQEALARRLDAAETPVQLAEPPSPASLGRLLARLQQGDFSHATLARLHREAVLLDSSPSAPAPHPTNHPAPQAGGVLAQDERSAHPKAGTSPPPAAAGDFVAAVAAYRAARAGLAGMAARAPMAPNAAERLSSRDRAEREPGVKPGGQGGRRDGSGAGLAALREALEGHREALSQLHRLAPPAAAGQDLLPVAAFLRHPRFEGDARRAVAAWAASAARLRIDPALLPQELARDWARGGLPPAIAVGRFPHALANWAGRLARLPALDLTLER